MGAKTLYDKLWDSHVVRQEADGTVAAYARSQHLPERRRMMQAWADTCDALETGADVAPSHGRQRP